MAITPNISVSTDRRPFRVGFLLVDGFALMSYAAVIEPLRAANLLAGRPLYAFEQIPAAGASSESSTSAIIAGTASMADAPDLDLLLVVAGGDPMQFRSPKVFQWLRSLARRGIPLGGVSGGPVLLARAGVMAGRRMTVHWEHLPVLEEFDPDLMLERTLFVLDRDRLTCAGGTAPLDMMHAVITRHHGAGFARQVSDWFMHTEVRPSGGPQRAGYVERFGTTNRTVIEAIEIMETHVADPLTLTQLATLSGVGTRHLNRLFLEKLGMSTMQFYRRRRLEMAQKLLQQSTLSVTEVAQATGFSGSAHFSQAFKTFFGDPPSLHRR